MKKLDLFKRQKKLFVVMATFSIVACIFIYYYPNLNDFRLLTFTVFLTSSIAFVFNFIQINKYYFIIDKGLVKWKILHMTKESRIEFSENATISEISSNWKGIFFKSENDEHCILTDGLSKNQKQIIVEGLENYPTFLS